MEVFVEYVFLVAVTVPGLLFQWVLHRGKVSLQRLSEQGVRHNATYTWLVLVTAALAQQLCVLGQRV